MATDAQITANQHNAQLSTGPTSPEGKAISSQNALKFGIFSQAMIFPDEDPAALETLRKQHLDSLKPEGPIESELVETIVRSVWFGRRCDRLEPVIAKLTMDPSKPVIEALAALFSNTRNNPMAQLFRRRQAHQRDWFRALKELQVLQKQRREAAELLAPPKNGFVFTPGLLRPTPIGANPPGSPSAPQSPRNPAPANTSAAHSSPPPRR